MEENVLGEGKVAVQLLFSHSEVLNEQEAVHLDGQARRLHQLSLLLGRAIEQGQVERAKVSPVQVLFGWLRLIPRADLGLPSCIADKSRHRGKDFFNGHFDGLLVGGRYGRYGCPIKFG